MQPRRSIQVPQEIQSYLWTRYLPEASYKTYVMIGYINEENLNVQEANKVLDSLNLENEFENDAILNEKVNVLKKLGFDYPSTIEENIKLLKDFRLINEIEDKHYVYQLPVPKPEEVLNIDEEEKLNLENIRFEIKNHNAFNMFLTLLLNSNGNLATTLDHIQKTTGVKLTSLKEVLEHLVEEGSIKVKSSKKIKDLRKGDKVYISVVKDVFEQKRFVL